VCCYLYPADFLRLGGQCSDDREETSAIFCLTVIGTLLVLCKLM